MSSPPVFSPPVADRLAGFGTTIFAEITALANRHGAINLGQGFPDFDGPRAIVDAAERAMRAGHNQYAPMSGVAALREAIAARWRADTGLAVDPDREITVTAGATEAIPAALLGLVRPGDEVVVFEPYYDSYPAAIAMAGGVPRFVTLRGPGFRFDERELRAAFTGRTRVVIVNTPHNPTGRVLDPGELSLIAHLAERHGCVVIADEVYDRLTYGVPHTSIATLPGMAERTITINSLGKTYSLTGWKVGWTIASAALSTAVRAAHQFLTFAVATPLQHAAAVALGLGPGYDHTFRAEYAERRVVLCDALRRAGFDLSPPEGTYFVMARFDGVAAPAAARSRDAAMARWMIESVGVACIPPSSFYHARDASEGVHWLRFSFSKRLETLHAAIERLERLPR